MPSDLVVGSLKCAERFGVMGGWQEDDTYPFVMNIRSNNTKVQRSTLHLIWTEKVFTLMSK